MRIIKEFIIACLITWVAVQAMGCTGLMISKDVAYQAIVK